MCEGRGMNRKKLSAVIAWVFMSLILALVLFCAFFNIEALIEGKIRHALEPCSSAQVTIPPGRRLAIYGGFIELLEIRATDFRRPALAMKELNARFCDISLDLSHLAGGGLSSVRSLHGDGAALIDETSLSQTLGQKSPRFMKISARLLPGMIQIQAKTALFDITVSGNLAIVEGTKIDFKIQEADSSRYEKSRINQLISLVNPVFDVESLNLADTLLRKLPEKEKKKWEIRIIDLKATKGILEAGFTVDKRP
jgi:hypothetical protein